LEDLLFLAHRIPYPPNKGDKIRSWNILKHLAGRYRVRLGCLIDDPHDRQYVTELERHCAEVMAVPIDPFRQRIRALLKSRPGSPLSAAYFQTPELSDWVYETIRRRRIEQALVFSTPMMASLPPWHGYAMRVVLDMVDVDSKKWREMAEKTAGPKRWIYWREARTLADFERKAAAGAAYTLLSSDVEAALFAASAPELAGRIGAMGNGVDLDYFSPAHGFRRPYPGSAGDRLHRRHVLLAEHRSGRLVRARGPSDAGAAKPAAHLRHCRRSSRCFGTGAGRHRRAGDRAGR